MQLQAYLAAQPTNKSTVQSLTLVGNTKGNNASSTSGNNLGSSSVNSIQRHIPAPKLIAPRATYDAQRT